MTARQAHFLKSDPEHLLPGRASRASVTAEAPVLPIEAEHVDAGASPAIPWRISVPWP